MFELVDFLLEDAILYFELFALNDHFLSEGVDLQVMLFTLASYLVLLVFDEFVLLLSGLLSPFELGLEHFDIDCAAFCDVFFQLHLLNKRPKMINFELQGVCPLLFELS